MSAHGKHIKVVGYGDRERLGVAEGVRRFLVDIVGAVGMRPLGEPVIHDVKLDLAKLNVEPFDDEGGVTGVCVLSTSHCSIHTWPLRQFFVMDLYSCRDFNEALVTEAIHHHFGPGIYRLTDLTASLRPPELPLHTS